MKEPLLSLAPVDLRALAAAISSGRLNAPYLGTGVQRFVNRETVSEIASSLQRFANEGASPIALARTLELLADGLTSRPLIEELVDLVTTGPDCGEASRDTAVVVRDLFHNAAASVVVVGYAVHQGHKVFQALADRMAACPSLQVRMCLDIQRRVGDTSEPSELVKAFVDRFKNYQWPPGRPIPEVYYDPRSLELEQRQSAALHAKCIVVDGCRVFVSSANFTEAAQQKNIEVGLLLHSTIVANRLLRFFGLLVGSGHFKRII